MFAFLLTLNRFLLALRRSFRDPEFRAIAFWVLVVLLVGTLFYWQVEGWDPLDAFYFCVVTLATVGYGDFTPRTPLGKVFTIVYIFLGIGLIVVFARKIAGEMVEHRRQRLQRRIESDAEPTEDNSPQEG